MITLSEAFKLCQIRDDEVVRMVKEGDSYPWYAPSFYTGAEIRKRMDMKKIQVVHIRPYFAFYEYQGMAFEVRGL